MIPSSLEDVTWPKRLLLGGRNLPCYIMGALRPDGDCRFLAGEDQSPCWRFATLPTTGAAGQSPLPGVVQGVPARSSSSEEGA
jgi:hypothetical protein